MTRAEAELPLYVQAPLRNVQNGRHDTQNGFAKRAFAHHRHCGSGANEPPRTQQRL